MSMLLVASLRHADRHDRAAQYILDQLDEDPESDETLSRLADVLADGGREDDAIDLINNRLLRTRRREDFQNLANALMQGAKQYPAATAHLERLIGHVEFVEQDVRRRRDQRRDTAADGLIDRPDEPATPESLRKRLDQLRGLMAGTLIESERYDDASELLTEWLDVAEDPRLRFGYLGLLSACYQRSGDSDNAVSVTLQALALDPMNPGHNNDLAYVWIDQGIRLDEAEKMIRRSVASAPSEGAYLDTYGWLLYKKGEFAEAEKWLLRAVVARSQGDPVIYDHLGDTLWHLGRKEEEIGRASCRERV